MKEFQRDNAWDDFHWRKFLLSDVIFTGARYQHTQQVNAIKMISRCYTKVRDELKLQLVDYTNQEAIVTSMEEYN